MIKTNLKRLLGREIKDRRWEREEEYATNPNPFFRREKEKQCGFCFGPYRRKWGLVRTRACYLVIG